MAIPELSTSILVSWSPPPLDDENGILISYHLNYSSDEAFAGPIRTFTVNATVMTKLVDGLEEFVTYSFVVAAETSAGIGPYNDPAITTTTFQDGMWVCVILMHCCLNSYDLHMHIFSFPLRTYSDTCTRKCLWQYLV